MFDRLQTSAPFELDETHRLKFLFPLAVAILSFLRLFLSSVLAETYNLESALACPPHTLFCAFTLLLSNLLASPLLLVPSFRQSLMHEPASQSWFLKILSPSYPLLSQFF